jgi:hypothetical protein
LLDAVKFVESKAVKKKRSDIKNEQCDLYKSVSKDKQQLG